MTSAIRKMSALSALLIIGGLALNQAQPIPEEGSDAAAAPDEHTPPRRSALTRWLDEALGSAQAERAAAAQLEPRLMTWRSLYGEQPPLSPEQTERLKQARIDAARRVVEGIAQGGAAAVPGTLERLRGDSGSREKLLLVEGLGQNPSAEAVTALEAVYREQGIRRLREDALRALGRSEAPGRSELLQAVMMEEADGRLSQVAAMALHGDGASLGPLVAAIYSSRPMNTRLEAVHSLAGIGDAAASEALARVAADPELGPRVQAYAQRELARLSG